MTPKEAKQKAVYQNEQKIDMVIVLLIEYIDGILIREIDSLIDGGEQTFRMYDFAKSKLSNIDNYIYTQNSKTIVEKIIKNYRANGWIAEDNGEQSMVLQDIKIRIRTS